MSKPSANGKFFTKEKWERVNQENKDVMEDFLNSKINLSPSTEYQYTQALRMFFIWVLENARNKSIRELKSRDFIAYQKWNLSRGLTAGTTTFRRSAVSSLCNFIEIEYIDEEEGYEKFKSIVKNVERPIGSKKHEKQPLTVEELNLLRKALKEKKDWQRLAYVELSYSTGARLGAISSLRKEIANAEPNKVGDKVFYYTHPVREKGSGRDGEVRKLTFSQEAMDTVKKWLKQREEMYGEEDDCEFLFVTKNKKEGVKQVATNTINYWCSKHFTEIVGRRVHPHLFRSTRATHLVVEEGKNIESAQALLGHKSSETTKIYVVNNNEEDIADCF